jgi:hypothetical protein
MQFIALFPDLPIDQLYAEAEPYRFHRLPGATLECAPPMRLFKVSTRRDWRQAPPLVR